MRRSRWNSDRVSGHDGECFRAEAHHAIALGKMINLLRRSMQMQCGLRAWRDACLGQALLAIAMNAGMHQFANRRAVFGDIGLNCAILALYYFHSRNIITYGSDHPSFWRIAMFKHILIPCDGSELSNRVVNKAIEFAGEIDARITGFYAQPEYSVPYYEGGIPIDAMTPDSFTALTQSQAKTILDSFAEKAGAAGVTFDVHTLINDSPYEAIIDAANAKGCDLIFMASHGRRGIAGLLMGSETHKVLTHTMIPVLVYR